MVNDNNNNQPIGIACVTRDVSTRKQREDALEQSESRFRMLFEKSSDGFYFWIEINFSILNEGAANLLCSPYKNDFLKLCLGCISDASTWKIVFEMAEDVINKVLQHGLQRIDWTFKKISGELFYAKYYSRFCLWAIKKLFRWFGERSTFFPITFARRKNRNRLRRSFWLQYH